MTKSQKLIELTEKHKTRIYETVDYIWKHPETGFREWKTS